MTFDEYLAIEERSPIRHELVGGQLYAMTGSTKRHNEVAARIFSLARQHIGEHCAAYISDVMLRVGDTGYYPDVIVTCDPDDHDRYETRPCLLVEVLSPSTQGTDRREKSMVYRGIDSLRTYLIVDPLQPAIEAHERIGREWVARRYGPGDVIVLPCPPDTTLDLDALYAT